MTQQKSSLFVTFEGGEGSGKTTVMAAIAVHLEKQGHDVLTTREPGATDLGAKIRHILLHEKSISITSKAELFLFLADRAQHVEEVIKPALKKGSIVLCDRFVDSTLAYQGAARQIDESFIKELCQFTTGNLIPDLTLFLHIDPQEALKRASDTPDRLETEKLAFHNRVLEGFECIAKAEKERVKQIDSTQSLEDVVECAKIAINAKLNKTSSR